MRYVLLALALSGCAMGPIAVDERVGNNFTIEHGTARFQDAMAGAQQHCARRGMNAKHLGTDRGGELLLSRFECARG